jgi:hypothetical protein
MRKDKRTRLEARGWKFGTAKDFLNLSEEESAYIELKIRLSEALRQRRQDKGLSQVDLAAKLRSSNRASPRWKQAIPRYPWTCSSAPSSRSEPQTANSPRSSRHRALHK